VGSSWPAREKKSIRNHKTPPAVEISLTAPPPSDAVDILETFFFRFKQEQVQATRYLRTHADDGKDPITIETFLATIPETIIDDSEQIALLVRKLRRETAERSALQEASSQIIHHEKSPLAQPVRSSSLEIAPNIFYCGPELTEQDSPPFLRGFEAGLHNIHRAMNSISRATPTPE
jgi:hypothetical protein